MGKGCGGNHSLYSPEIRRPFSLAPPRGPHAADSASHNVTLLGCTHAKTAQTTCAVGWASFSKPRRSQLPSNNKILTIGDWTKKWCPKIRTKTSRGLSSQYAKLRQPARPPNKPGIWTSPKHPHPGCATGQKEDGSRSLSSRKSA